MTAKVITVRVWWLRLLTAGGFGSMAILLGLGFSETSRLLGIAGAFLVAVLAVRGARSGLQLSDRGFVARGLFRTRQGLWLDTSEAYLGSGSSTGLPFKIPVFTVDGRPVKIEEVRSLRRDGAAEEAVELANQYMDEAKRRSQGCPNGLG